MNTRHKICFYINLILTLAIMTIIFMFSMESGNESAGTSDSLKKALLSIISPVLPDAIVNFIDVYLRKIAHFTLYFLLGITVSLGLKSCCAIYYPAKKDRISLFAAALLICVIYAVSDEIHQYFVPGRSAKISDVLLDTSGALLSISIHCLINHFKRRTIS